LSVTVTIARVVTMAWLFR